jgi:hypothetical protein
MHSPQAVRSGGSCTADHGSLLGVGRGASRGVARGRVGSHGVTGPSNVEKSKGNF